MISAREPANRNKSNKNASACKAGVPSRQLAAAATRTIFHSAHNIFVQASGFRAIIGHGLKRARGARQLDHHRYTRNEVERMMGISRRDLDYWTRLRLVIPRA